MRSVPVTVCFIVGMVSGGIAEGLRPERRPLVAEVVESILRTDYERALRITDSLAALGDPAFMMLRLNTLGMREMDFELVIDSAAVTAEFRRTIETLDRIEAVQGQTAYTVTVRGFVMAGMASYDLRRREYGDAVRIGIDALRLLQRAVVMDSSVADPDYFLGLYDWSKADLRRRLWWVLFWLPGDRQRGIRRMERCRTSSLFASAAASLSLVDVYVQERRFAEADVLLSELGERYPTSRYVLWALARRREAGGDFAGAAAVYGRLADSYEREQYGRRNAVICRFTQASLLERAGDYVAADRVCRQVLERCGTGTDDAEPCGAARKMQRRLRQYD